MIRANKKVASRSIGIPQRIETEEPPGSPSRELPRQEQRYIANGASTSPSPYRAPTAHEVPSDPTSMLPRAAFAAPGSATASTDHPASQRETNPSLGVPDPLAGNARCQPETRIEPPGAA